MKDQISNNILANDAFSQFIASLYRNQDFTTEVITALNRPHNNYYTSNLHPVFLQDLFFSNIFPSVDHLYVRDGALFLFKYFTKNIKQLKQIKNIFIHKNLYYLVPKELRDNIWTYSYTLIDHPRQEASAVSLFATFDEDIDRDLFSFSKWLSSVKKELHKNKSIKSIYICFNATFFSNGLNPVLDTPQHYKQALLKLGAELAQYELIFVNEKQIHNIGNFGEMAFDIFNPFYFNFSDSYITHAYLTQGAQPLFSNDSDFQPHSSSSYALSSFHGVNIQKLDSKATFYDEFEHQKPLIELMEKVIEQEKYKSTLQNDRYELYLTTPEFKELVLELAKQHEERSSL